MVTRGKIMFFNKNAKLKLFIVNFFFGDEPDQLSIKKSVVSIVILRRSFLLVLGFYYILTYYFYQILGNTSLIVKFFTKIFFSTLTKQCFFFCNIYHYSITEPSTSIKHINEISNYTII